MWVGQGHHTCGRDCPVWLVVGVGRCKGTSIETQVVIGICGWCTRAAVVWVTLLLPAGARQTDGVATSVREARVLGIKGSSKNIHKGTDGGPCNRLLDLGLQTSGRAAVTCRRYRLAIDSVDSELDVLSKTLDEGKNLSKCYRPQAWQIRVAALCAKQFLSASLLPASQSLATSGRAMHPLLESGKTTSSRNLNIRCVRLSKCAIEQDRHEKYCLAAYLSETICCRQ